MRIEMSDERDSSWEEHLNKFRVYFFGMPGPGYAVRTFDITGATFSQAMNWAEEEAGECMYSIALVANRGQDGRGLVWLIGNDANDDLSPLSGDVPRSWIERQEIEMRLHQEMEESLLHRQRRERNG